jgi:hypothetical protein
MKIRLKKSPVLSLRERPGYNRQIRARPNQGIGC